MVINRLVSNLSDLALRKRIDGINFTCIKPIDKLNDDKFSKEEIKAFKILVLKDALSKISTIFPFDNMEVEIYKERSILDLNGMYGVYIELHFRGVDLFVLIQFKGYYFINTNSFSDCRTHVLGLSKRFDELFRITSIDVAQDFAVRIDELLPDPLSLPANIKYCFKHKCKKFHENTSKDRYYTGFVISAGRFKVTVYDKIKENEKSRNPEKKKYYENIYSKFKDKSVTRIELRLKQEACKVLNHHFLNFKMTEEKFLRICLFQIYRKHKLRYRKIKSSDSDFRRWPIHSNWKFIFCQILPSDHEEVSCPDFLYTSQDLNLERAFNHYINVLSALNPDITENELREKFSNVSCKDMVEKVQRRVTRRKNSLKKLDTNKKEILRTFHSLQDPQQGNWGSITSPVERSEIIESNT